MTDIWTEPIRGGYPDPGVLAFSGLEMLQMGAAGLGMPPPMSYLTGLRIAEASEDQVVFSMPASDWFLSSQEQISVGAITMLADAALGSGVQLRLPPATPYTTSELSMTFLGPCPPGGELRAVGRSLHDGRPLAVSDVWVANGTGAPVAHGTSTCFVFPPLEGIQPPEDPTPPTPPVYDTPHPFERPAAGEVIPWDLWRTMTGLELLRKQIAGELPPPPIHFLTGMTLREASSGAVAFSLPASEWLTSPLRTVQGGAIAMLAHAAVATAVTTTLEAGTGYRPVDVKVNFLRPVHPGGELTATGAVTHRGRTLAVAHSEVHGHDGKKVAVATGSTMIVPGRG